MTPRRPAKRLVEASEALAARDRTMRSMLERVGPVDLHRGRPRREHFAALARAILYQQLAGRAAAAIHGRFVALFDGDNPTPEAVLAVPRAQLRRAGLSGNKAASIRDLAEKVVDGSVQIDRMRRLPDDEIVRQLTLVRGIGPWTAEMFLIFQLGRLDVWPVGDYGVRKGYALLYGLSDPPGPKELEPLGDRFRPYRTVAAWYCWRAAETVTPGEE
ncbi:MAG TPA: DNA-3-methyladenine glycosylase 2 family protein [Acidimicrobiia bacterium]|nr:DNA-3-methyladenine glycosylase 2 family protein [Acidimicrobiia bacterium]